MTPALRWLIWLAALVACFSITQDWQDELNKLRPERKRIERLRQHEESAMLSINWTQQAERAQQAQLAWQERLPEVTQMGVFRAEAMEAMADLCKQLETNCQVSALGETASNQAHPNSINLNTRPSESNTFELPGLVSTSVRLNVNLTGDKLTPLLNEIERGRVLRKVEKFSVRGGQADMVVKTFGIESQRTPSTTAGASKDNP